MSLPRVLHKFRARSRADRRLLIEAVIRLGVMRVMILLLPFRWIVRLYHLKQGASAIVSNPCECTRAGHIGWAVRVGAAHMPWHSTCLAQSLTAMAMLRRRGISGTLYLGVARSADAGKVIIAHSWLCSGDAVLTGAGGDQQFTPVASFSWR